MLKSPPFDVYKAAVVIVYFWLSLVTQVCHAQTDQNNSQNNEEVSIKAFIGKGENSGTGVHKPGTYSYSISPSSSESGSSTSQSVELKVKYGVDLFGRDVELDCTTPWTVEKKQGQNNSTGFESITCGAKIQFYNNQENGTSASAKISLKDSNILGYGLSDGNSGARIIIPITVLQLLAGGDAAVVGTVTLNQALDGSGTQLKYAAGMGAKLSQTSSISGDISYTNTGKTTADGILGYQISKNTLFWVKIWKSVTHSSGNNEIGASAGLEITLDRDYLSRTNCQKKLCLKQNLNND